MATKFYAVREGYQPGIYKTWDECLVQVKGYPAAACKSFANRTDAEDFMNGKKFPSKKELRRPKRMAVRHQPSPTDPRDLLPML
jgi:viroplasmin and RNaseH domain-containing protein